VQITPIAAITALVRARYIGEAIDKAMPTDDYVLVEGTLTARLGGEYLGVLKVDDALDVQPETRIGYHMPGRTNQLSCCRACGNDVSAGVGPVMGGHAPTSGRRYTRVIGGGSLARGTGVLVERASCAKLSSRSSS